MNEILRYILYIVISAVLSVGGALCAKYIRTKTNWQYKDEIADAVTVAVGCVQQTFVDKAKGSGMFNEENQTKARSMALALAKELLTPEAADYLHNKRTDKQANDYMIALIEKAVRTQKKEM